MQIKWHFLNPLSVREARGDHSVCAVDSLVGFPTIDYSTASSFPFLSSLAAWIVNVLSCHGQAVRAQVLIVTLVAIFLARLAAPSPVVPRLVNRLNNLMSLFVMPIV